MGRLDLILKRVIGTNISSDLTKSHESSQIFQKNKLFYISLTELLKIKKSNSFSFFIFIFFIFLKGRSTIIPGRIRRNKFTKS